MHGEGDTIFADADRVPINDQATPIDDASEVDTIDAVNVECPYGGAVSFNVESSLPRRGRCRRWRRSPPRGGDGKNSLR